MAENKKESNGKKPSGKESWQDRKLKKVVRDDIDVISRKTLDQSDFITMLNTHDNVLHRLRMTMGRNSNITFENAQEFIERSQQIREEINLLNAEMCQLMDWDYTPPRGFTNPLGEKEGKGKVKKAAVKVPAAENLAEADVATA
ncbi:MAG TPA: hypothetical protein VGJ93_15160 [Desulfuromonadaceae bacterium]|jgi:hypothetical protein